MTRPTILVFIVLAAGLFPEPPIDVPPRPRPEVATDRDFEVGDGKHEPTAWVQLNDKGELETASIDENGRKRITPHEKPKPQKKTGPRETTAGLSM